MRVSSYIIHLVIVNIVKAINSKAVAILFLAALGIYLVNQIF